MLSLRRLLVRRRRLLLVVLALILIVRVALPSVIRRVAVDQADKALVGRIELDDVDLSFLTGSLTLHGLRVFATEAAHIAPGEEATAPPPAAGEGAPGSAPVFSARRLLVQLGYRALFRKVVELQRVELDGFAVSLDRAADGTLVLPAPVPAAVAEQPKEAATPGWGVLIQRVALREGRIGFRDFAVGDPPQHVEGQVPTLDAGNLALLITEGGVEPGKVALDAGIEDGTLHLEVTLEQAAAGPVYQSHAVLSNLPIGRGRVYIPRVGWSDLAGRLDLDLVHRFESQGAHTVHGSVGLRDLAIRVPDLDEPALAWTALAVDIGAVDFVRRHAEIAGVTVSGLHVATRPSAPELLPVLHGLAPAAEAQNATPPPVTGGDTAAQPWTWTLAKVAVQDAHVHALGGDGPIDVRIDATVAGLASALDTPTKLDLSLAPSSGGTLAVGGDLTIRPLAFDGTLRIEALPLAPLTQPIANPQTRLLKNGVANLDLEIAAGATPKAPPAGVRIAGKIGLTDFDVGSEDPKPFALRWHDLAIEVRELSAPGILTPTTEQKPGPILVTLGRFSLVRPEIVATRTEHGITLPAALGPAAAPARAPTSGTPAPAAPPLDVQVRIDTLDVRTMGAAFSDEAVRPFYRSSLDPIDLSCSDLRWPGPNAKNVRVVAKGLDGGRLNVSGNVAPAGSRLQITLDGLPLAPFNPYAASSGYGVAGGTAKLDSKIMLAPSSYDTTSKIVLHQLAVTSGEGDALFTSRFGMPLSLALALMTDLEGNIVLDVPISGDASGMKTGLGTLVGNALARAILNAVTSPLKLVGAVAHLGEKPASLTPQPIAFQPGRSDLAAGEEAKLAPLGHLLAAAPGVRLHLRGEAGDDDRRWLREQALKAKLEHESGVLGTVRHIGERGARGAAAQALEERAQGKPGEVPEEHKAWFEAQVAAQEVPDATVRALAAARATAVQARLGTSEGVSAERIVVDDPTLDPGAHPIVAIGLGSPAATDVPAAKP